MKCPAASSVIMEADITAIAEAAMVRTISMTRTGSTVEACRLNGACHLIWVGDRMLTILAATA
jgi:hypothetical protein